MYDRYAKATLSAHIECLNYHPTGNCTHPRRIRLRVDGADWQIAEVGTVLRHLTALPQKTKDATGEVTVPLTWAMVTQLSKLMEERGYGWCPDPGLNKWISEEFTRRFTEHGDLKYDIGQLDWEPMPHQVAGAFVGALNKRFFFCDDMRTGKTRTALLTMAELTAQNKGVFPALVICPASVIDQWLEEIETAFPQYTATAYRGGSRKNLSSRYHIYVASWPTFTRDMKHEKDELPPLLKFIVPQTVVMDEAHCLCNTKTRQSSAARQIARVCEYAFPMSGTPITHDVGGFWSALNVLDIRSFPDQDRYKDRYVDRVHTDYSEQVEGIKKDSEFFTLVQGSMRRISKRDVNEDLPPASYSTRAVDIPPAYRKAYDEMEQDMIAHIPDTDEPLEVMSTLAQLQRLTQLAGSACDVEIEMVLETREDHPMFGELVPKYHVTMREPSWKVDELMEVMAENDCENNPLLVFSPHTQLVKIAAARAENAGYRVGEIVGGQTPKQRTAIRKAYQGGELDVLCLNLTAGGVGLTLNRGDTVVFLERSWAYWQNYQSESRADDVRNAKQVHVLDIVARKTVESRVREALKTKAGHLSDLVRDPRIVTELLGGQPIRV